MPLIQDFLDNVHVINYIYHIQHCYEGNSPHSTEVQSLYGYLSPTNDTFVANQLHVQDSQGETVPAKTFTQPLPIFVGIIQYF